MKRSGVAESHLMIEVAGLIIMVLVAGLLYIVFSGAVDGVKDVICDNTESMRMKSKFLMGVFGFC